MLLSFCKKVAQELQCAETQLFFSSKSRRHDTRCDNVCPPESTSGRVDRAEKCVRLGADFCWSNALSELHVIRGRIVDLRRYINAHVYWRRPPSPTERYELWIRQLDGREFKITIQTQTMPARPGHVVSVIVKANASSAHVLGLYNASTMDAANYMRTDPPLLLRLSEFVTLAVVFLLMAAWLGDVGMVLFLVLALIYLLTASFSRTIYRALWRARVERVLADEAARNGWRRLR